MRVQINEPMPEFEVGQQIEIIHQAQVIFSGFVPENNVFGFLENWKWNPKFINKDKEFPVVRVEDPETEEVTRYRVFAKSQRVTPPFQFIECAFAIGKFYYGGKFEDGFYIGHTNWGYLRENSTQGNSRSYEKGLLITNLDETLYCVRIVER